MDGYLFLARRERQVARDDSGYPSRSRVGDLLRMLWRLLGNERCVLSGTSQLVSWSLPYFYIMRILEPHGLREQERRTKNNDEPSRCMQENDIGGAG